MPDFTPDDINIDPGEFVDSCSSIEIGSFGVTKPVNF